MRVLALDFDGVLCDSAREAFLVALRTYATFEPASPLVAEVRGRLGSLDTDPRGDPAFAGFLDLLPLGNRAEDFGVALRALEEGVHIPDQDAYDAFYGAQDGGWRDEFHGRFYSQRAMLRDGDRDAWLRLHAVYRPLPEIVGRMARRVRLAVVTAKDETSARVLLRSFGLEQLFPPGTVLDKETGVQKTDHLRRVREIFRVGFGDITFVDDKVKHLQRAAALGVRPVLAGWGYNTPREVEVAHCDGIPVATLVTLEPLLLEQAAP